MPYMTQKVKSQIVIEAIGKTYNELTVIKLKGFKKTPRGANVPYVLCSCSCGKSKVISLWDVRNGKSKTCGLDHPHYLDRTLPAFHHIYNHSYKNRAIKIGIKFEINKDDFRSMCESACHYCGTMPENVSYRPHLNSKKGTRVQSGQFVSEWIYNGLDRIDPRKGYTLDNVVACCGICNHAKHTMSYEDFTAYLDRVAKFRK